MSSVTDFVIEDGVLLKYVGADKDVVIPETVVCIGKEAFAYPIGVHNVEIPDSVISISERAFYHCLGLTSVKIAGSVTSIGDEAFANCYNLKNVELQEGLQIIGKGAFSGSGLKDIVIPSSVIKIGNDFVREKTNIITDISDINIFPPAYRPKMVINYANGQYDVSDPRNESYQKYIKANAGKLIKLAVENPGLLALMCREKLITPKNAEPYMKAVQESGNVESIALMLDYMGSIDPKKKKQVKDNEEKQQEKVLEKKISHKEKTGIAGLVFVVSGKVQTFANRDALKHYITENGSKLASAISANVDYLITNENANSAKFKKAEELGLEIITEQQFNKLADRKYWIEESVLKKYIGDEEEVTIPEGVTGIEYNAFYNCTSIKKIVIPEGVKEIGSWAFSGCSNLVSVTVPESIEKIGKQPFYNTPWLEAQPSGIISVGRAVIGYTGNDTDVVIPDGTKIIGDCVFEYNNGLVKVVLPASVKSIGDWAFAYCDNLEDLELSDGLDYIGSFSFSNCNSLSRIVIPKSVKNIAYSAFSECVNLKTLELPAGLYSIGSFAFSGCKSLTKIVIPDVVKIGSLAFSECRALTNMTIPVGVKEIGLAAFDKCKKLTISTYKGSYAEQYAKGNGIPVAYIEA